MFRDTKAFSSFSVNDIQAAKKFYTSLGLKITEDPQMHVLVLQIADALHLIYPKDNHEPATFTVLNFPVDNIEQAVQQLDQLGIELEHYDLPEIKTDANGICYGPGPKIAWFKDPAGNILSVLEDKKHSR